MKVNWIRKEKVCLFNGTHKYGNVFIGDHRPLPFSNETEKGTRAIEWIPFLLTSATFIHQE